MTDPSFKTLLVLPAFNEEEALPKTIASLQELPPGFEILVVNDGSRDNTRAVANELARTSGVPFHVVHLGANSGIGVAVQTGYRFAAARNEYRYVIQFDSDGQHPAESIATMIAKCEQGYDLCVGSRFLDPERGGFRSTAVRRVGIRFFCWWIRVLSGVRVTDPTSGMRCAGPAAWKRFAEHYPEDYPEPESLFWCARNKLRIAEVPVTMRDRQGGVSSIRLGHAIYYTIKVALAILFDRLRKPEGLT